MVAPRIRTLFLDHLGLARTKYLPVAHAGHGTKHCLTLFSQHYDNQMTPEAPGTGFLEGMPDLEAQFEQSELRPSWVDGELIAVCDLWRNGQLLEHAPRTVLRRAIERWQALGLEPYVGLELEAYMMEPDGRGGWKALDTPGTMVYQTGPMADPHGLLDDILDAAAAAGLPVESVNTEYDAPQLELTLHYDSALKAVDDIVVFKLMAQEVARRKGLHLTFLGKPFANLTGSGMHVNVSLRDASGRNVMVDADGTHGMSTTARHMVGGMLQHHEALSAICAPTVNAYKRLRAGQLAGYWANWGLDHRSATVRVSPERGEGARLEHRLSDGAANPYLAVAAVLTAGWLGVQHQVEPPEIETGDGLEAAASTDRATPPNLAAALDALEADSLFADTFGRLSVDNFLAVKRDEWQKFAAAVTDWELDYYLPYH
jgi:glutamine synthetase